jgi:hypothetical protein
MNVLIHAIPLIAAMWLEPLQVSLDGRADGTARVQGVTVELKWEEPTVQRLTLRGKSDRAVLVRIHPRLVPDRVMYKGTTVKRTLGEWIESDAPVWRTAGDVLHIEVLVPAHLVASNPTVSLIGRSTQDDVTRAQGLIDFVGRVKPWLTGDRAALLSDELRSELSSIAIRHALKVDGTESSVAVGDSLRKELLALLREAGSRLPEAFYHRFAREVTGSNILTTSTTRGLRLAATVAWPFADPAVTSWESADGTERAQATASPDGTLLLTVRDRVGAEGRAIVSLHGLTFAVPLAPVRR